MGKKVDTSGFDTNFIIGQTKPGNRESPPPPAEEAVETETLQSVQESSEVNPPQEIKESSRRKRGQQAGYKEVFLKRNEMKTRQCVYISHDIHAVIAKLVRALVNSGNEISVGGYIDTVLNEHLQLHKDEINEIYRQRPDDLL